MPKDKGLLLLGLGDEKGDEDESDTIGGPGPLAAEDALQAIEDKDPDALWAAVQAMISHAQAEDIAEGE